ncbi:hypothetical protein Hanom_Chr09g00795401 [Helianthus anomalus]
MMMMVVIQFLGSGLGFGFRFSGAGFGQRWSTVRVNGSIWSNAVNGFGSVSDTKNGKNLWRHALIMLFYIVFVTFIISSSNRFVIT